MEYELIGWREHVDLPQFKLDNLKAKIDTGAKTSTLHAEEIQVVTLRGKKYVKFTFTDNSGKKRKLKAPFLEERKIKSSIGLVTIRPVVKTKIVMGKCQFELELTLINRDLMGFKMLIGRDALHGKFLIHPTKSYLLKNA